MDTKKKPILISFLLILLFVSIPFNIFFLYVAISTMYPNNMMIQILKAFIVLFSMSFSILSIIYIFKKKRNSLYFFAISSAPLICYLFIDFIISAVKNGIPLDSASDIILTGLIIPAGVIVLMVYSFKNIDAKNYLSK